MKISKYKVVDAGATVGAATSQFASGKLLGSFSASTDVRFEEGILVKDIVKVTELAAILTDRAFTQDVTFATAPSAGDEFGVTISFVLDGQKANRRFGHIAQAGALTVTDIAVAIKDKINGSDVPFTASNASGVLTITADVAGAGYTPILTAGTDSATTTVVLGAVTEDLEKSDAAYYAAKFDYVEASDFASQTVAYNAYVIEHLEDVDTVHGIVKEKRFGCFFLANGVGNLNLVNALNAATYDGDKFDLL
jgi:phage tail sheath gpL-like